MINEEADEVIKKRLDLFKSGYKNNLELIKVSEFVINYVYLLYYKCHKINPNWGGFYVSSPGRIKNQKKEQKLLWIKKTKNAFNML